jgi:hypothetical protein
MKNDDATDKAEPESLNHAQENQKKESTTKPPPHDNAKKLFGPKHERIIALDHMPQKKKPSGE